MRHSPRRRGWSRTRQDRDLGRRRIRHRCCAHGDGDRSFCDRDRQIAPLIYLTSTQYGARLQTLFATVQIIERQVRAADLVIGAVLVPGAAAPKLVRRETVRQMKRGAAIVDISIDHLRLFRDQPSDDLCRTDLRGRRRHPRLIALPTCRELWRKPRPSLSTTPLCRSRSPWPTGAGSAHSMRTCNCATGSMFSHRHITHPAVAQRSDERAKGLPSA